MIDCIKLFLSYQFSQRITHQQTNVLFALIMSVCKVGNIHFVKSKFAEAVKQECLIMRSYVDNTLLGLRFLHRTLLLTAKVE